MHHYETKMSIQEIKQIIPISYFIVIIQLVIGLIFFNNDVECPLKCTYYKKYIGESKYCKITVTELILTYLYEYCNNK